MPKRRRRPISSALPPFGGEGLVLLTSEFTARAGAGTPWPSSPLPSAPHANRSFSLHSAHRRPSHGDKRRAWRRELLGEEIRAVLHPGVTEREIAAAAERLLDLAA